MNGQVRINFSGKQPPQTKSTEALEQCFLAWNMSGWLREIDQAVQKDILDTAENVRQNFDALVVCGIGGNALGTKAVHTAINGIYYNENKNRVSPKIFIEDNIDPARVQELFDCIDLKKTMFYFASKSGETLETLAQLEFVTQRLVAANLRLDKHIIITVGERKSSLHEFAKKHDIKTFFLDSDIGGRFSVFSPVSLLPLAVSGVDIEGLLAGARKAQQNKERAREFADICAAEEMGGKNIIVLFNYVCQFKYISEWFMQLFAESVGKNDGGQTPLAALGTTDQHSLLQLFLDGANDKLFVFLSVEDCKSPLESFAKIQHASHLGTREALADKPIVDLSLPEPSEKSVGALLMFFMLAVSYLGAIKGVNPFDQPAVEKGKEYTKKILQQK